MIQRLRKLRIEIDYLHKLSLLLLSMSCFHDVTKSVRLAKMWLGKVLGEMKEITPYPQSSNPSNQVIEAEVDCYTGPVSFEREYNLVSAVKEMRRLIECNLKEYAEIEREITRGSDCYVFLQESKMRLTEAKLWLGVELGVIRDKVKAHENKQNSIKKKLFGDAEIMECKQEECADINGKGMLCTDEERRIGFPAPGRATH